MFLSTTFSDRNLLFRIQRAVVAKGNVTCIQQSFPSESPLTNPHLLESQLSMSHKRETTYCNYHSEILIIIIIVTQ